MYLNLQPFLPPISRAKLSTTNATPPTKPSNRPVIGIILPANAGSTKLPKNTVPKLEEVSDSLLNCDLVSSENLVSDIVSNILYSD